MNLILGMDIFVFLAWIGTILATILCVIYGLYYQFFKKVEEETPSKIENVSQKKEDE